MCIDTQYPILSNNFLWNSNNSSIHTYFASFKSFLTIVNFTARVTRVQIPTPAVNDWLNKGVTVLIVLILKTTLNSFLLRSPETSFPVICL